MGAHGKGQQLSTPAPGGAPSGQPAVRVPGGTPGWIACPLKTRYQALHGRRLAGSRRGGRIPAAQGLIQAVVFAQVQGLGTCLCNPTAPPA